MSLKGLGFVFCVGAVAFGLVGCGGGASPAANTGGGGGSPAISLGKVRLDVDLSNNTVKVVPVTDQTQPASRAVFSGSTLSVTSTTVATVPGNGPNQQLLSMNIAVNSPYYNSTLGPLNVMFQPTTGTGVLADTLAGGGATGLVDGTAKLATLGHPVGAWVDTDGTVFFTQTDSGAVRKLSGGNISTITTAISGPAGITGDSNYLYVTAQNSHQVFKITKSGQITNLLAGSGAAGFANGTGSGATFNTPTGIAIYQNILFVADYGNNAVRTVDINTGMTSTYQSGIPGAIGVATGTLGGLPVMAVTSNTSGYVKVVGISGGSVTLGDSAGTTGVAILPNDMLVVCNASNDTFRVLQVANNSAPLSLNSWYTVGSYGSGPGATDGTSPTFQTPFLMGYRQGTGMVIPDNGNNKLRDVALDPSAASGTNPCQFTNAAAFLPGHVPLYTTKPGNLLVGISSAQTQRFSLLMTVEGPTAAAINPSQDGLVNSPTLLTIPLAGKLNTYTNVAIDGIGENARLYDPLHVRWSNAGFAMINDGSSVVVADKYGRIRRISGAFGANSNGYGYGFSTLSGISYIDMNNSGTVAIVSAGNQIYRMSRSAGTDPFDPNSWYGSLIAGTTGSGSVNGDGSVSSFYVPYAAIPKDGNGETIYVSDSQNSLIREILLKGSSVSNPTSYTVYTIVGVSGPGYVNGIGSGARVSTPIYCTFGEDGNFYFYDQGNGRIRMLSADSPHTVSTVAGNGTSGFIDGALGTNEVNLIYDLNVGPTGAIYFVDTSYLRQINNGTVSTFGKSPNATTIYGIGVDRATGDIYWGDSYYFGKFGRIIN